MNNLPNWLYDNLWLVPVLICGGGVCTAVGSILAFKQPKSVTALVLLLVSAALQVVAGIVWYAQPARFGR